MSSSEESDSGDVECSDDDDGDPLPADNPLVGLVGYAGSSSGSGSGSGGESSGSSDSDGPPRSKPRIESFF